MYQTLLGPSLVVFKIALARCNDYELVTPFNLFSVIFMPASHFLN